MSSRILVTGGSGFIGSHVVDRLLAAGYRARILDTRPSCWHNGRSKVQQVIGDVRRMDDVARALRGCDAVCHLAAAADVGEVQKDPAWATELNAMGTLAVLDAARRTGVDRVVYASTVWVYSDVEGDVIDEDAPLRAPAHLYTAGKLSGELFCRSYAELYGLRPTIVRFGIPYGPRARPAAVIPSFVRRALAGEPLTIAGSGEQERSFVYVEDLAEGVVRALSPAAVGRTYNLGGNETVTIRQLAEVVSAEVGEVGIVHTEGRAGDLRGATIVSERAERELGWRAETPLREGVRRYIAWERSYEAAAQPAPAAARLPAVVHDRSPVVATHSPAVVARRLGTAVREPVVAGAISLLAVLSCLIPLWAAATGPEQGDAVTTVGIAVLMPLVALTFVRWPSALHRVQAALAAGLGAVAIVVLGLLGPDPVAALGHDHGKIVLLCGLGATAGIGLGARGLPARDRS